MGSHKQYTGYQSYQYLKEEQDYKRFRLAKELRRVPSAQVALSSAEERRVQELLSQNIAISMHHRPVVISEAINEIFEQKRLGRAFTSFERLATFGLDAMFDNLMNGLCKITSQAGWKWSDVTHDLGLRLCDPAHQDFLSCAMGRGILSRRTRPSDSLWFRHLSRQPQ